jgi:hypothetical protein
VCAVRGRHLLGRERAHVVIPGGHQRRACPKGRQLAVADGGQAATPGALAAGGPLRQIPRLSSRMASPDRGRPRQAAWSEHGQGALPRRQLGTRLLAGPKLAQACGRHGGRGRWGGDADHAAAHGGDAQHGRREGACPRAPTCSHAEISTDGRQPSIGEVARAALDADAPPERVRLCLAPRLDTLEPGVTRGEDAGQPPDGRPAETPALPMAMGRDVCLPDCGHAHLLAMRDERRESVYAFVGCGDCFAHPTSLPPCSFLSENSREMSDLKEFSLMSSILYRKMSHRC